MSISLYQGQKILLTNDILKKAILKFDWHTAKNMLLDASCIILDSDKNVLDIVYFNHIYSKDSSIVIKNHKFICIDFEKINNNVSYLVFIVTACYNQTFSKVKNVYCSLIDPKTNIETAKYEVCCSDEHTGVILTSIYRDDNNWYIHAIGEKFFSYYNFKNAMPEILRIVKEK